MFLSMTLGFCLMAGTYWLIARGNMDIAEKTQVVSPSFHQPRVSITDDVQGNWRCPFCDEHVRLVLFRGRAVLEHWHDVNSSG